MVSKIQLNYLLQIFYKTVVVSKNCRKVQRTRKKHIKGEIY